MEGLTADIMIHIFSIIDDPRKIVCCEAVCSLWKAAASSETVWSSLLQNNNWSRGQTRGSKSSKVLFVEQYRLKRAFELEERMRTLALCDWARDLWQEYELGLSSCTS